MSVERAGGLGDVGRFAGSGRFAALAGVGRLAGLSRGPGVMDVALALALAAAPILDIVVHDATAETGSAQVVMLLLLVAAVSLAIRRRFPVTVVVVCGACVVASMALGYRSAVLACGPAVALYTVGLLGRRALSCVVIVAAAVVMGVATILVEGVAPFSAHLLAHVALVASPVLAGEVMRGRRAAVALRLERAELLLRAEREAQWLRIEQERRRIARDLHDVVGHALSTINVQASVAAHLIDGRPEFARQALREISAASGAALRDVRGLVGVLRESDGTAAPVDAGPRLSDLAALVERARRMAVQATLVLRDGGLADEVPESVQVAAYRIVQESLTNIHKHAGEVRATVEVEVGFDEVRLRVWNAAGRQARERQGRERQARERDAGERTGRAALPGAGLVGMRERAVILGGVVDAGPAADGGYEIRARLPLRAPSSPDGIGLEM